MNKEEEDLYMYNIANYIGAILANGIKVGDEVISFTMLDYYCVTKENIYTLVGKIRRNNVRDKYKYHSYLTYFAEKEGLLVREVDDIEEIVNEHHAFIIDGKRFEPTRDDIENVYNLFEVNKIPKYSKLIYIALHRMALGIPILPLFVEKEKSKTR